MLFPHRINLPIRTYSNLLQVLSWDNFNLPLSFIQAEEIIQTDKLVSSFCFHLLLNRWTFLRLSEISTRITFLFHFGYAQYVSQTSVPYSRLCWDLCTGRASGSKRHCSNSWCLILFVEVAASGPKRKWRAVSLDAGMARAGAARSSHLGATIRTASPSRGFTNRAVVPQSKCCRAWREQLSPESDPAPAL